MIQCTHYSEPDPGGWRPGLVLTDDRGYRLRRSPYGKIVRYPLKLDHELPWCALVAHGTYTVRAYFRTARAAFKWTSGRLRSRLTGGRHGEGTLIGDTRS